VIDRRRTWNVAQPSTVGSISGSSISRSSASGVVAATLLGTVVRDLVPRKWFRGNGSEEVVLTQSTDEVV